MVEQPRPVGSVENEIARDHLVGQLQRMGFDVDHHEGIGGRVQSDDQGEETSAALTKNLVASRPGTDTTGTIVLATHLDSVPGAPGAADAGVGIAVILEAVRALGPAAQHNDLVVVIVDGEEDGLLGSLALLQSDIGDLASPVVVLNHEARGTSGRPLVLRWSGPMQEVMASMPRPEAESFTGALFSFIPNDTDFTEYRAAGWWGLDMAIIDDSWAYHTPQDDQAHLDPSSVQHYGEMTLALTEDLLTRDLATLGSDDVDPVSTTAPWGIFSVPATLILVLATAAPVALVLSLGLLARRRLVRWRGALLGALGGLLALLGGGGVAFAAWAATTALRPEMLSVVLGEPVVAWPFLAAEGLYAVGAGLIVWTLLGRWFNVTTLSLGGALTASLVAGALALVSPELGGWLVLPICVAAFGTLGTVALGWGQSTRVRQIVRLLVRVLAVLPMGWVVGSQLSGTVEFGMATSNGMLAMLVLVSLLGVAPLALPSDHSGAATSHGSVNRSSRTVGRRLLAAAGVLALGVVFSGLGVLLQGGAGEPTQEEVIAEIDTDADTTVWSTTGSSSWGQELEGATADAAELEAPRCVSDPDASPASDGRRVRLEVSSPRDAQRVLISPVEGTMRDISVDGATLPSSDEGSTRLVVAGVAPGQKIVVEFTGSPELSALSCTDETHQLADAPGWQPPPDDVSLIQPVVRVTETISV